MRPIDLPHLVPGSTLAAPSPVRPRRVRQAVRHAARDTAHAGPLPALFEHFPGLRPATPPEELEPCRPSSSTGGRRAGPPPGPGSHRVPRRAGVLGERSQRSRTPVSRVMARRCGPALPAYQIRRSACGHAWAGTPSPSRAVSRGYGDQRPPRWRGLPWEQPCPPSRTAALPARGRLTDTAGRAVPTRPAAGAPGPGRSGVSRPIRTRTRRPVRTPRRARRAGR